MPLQAVGDAPVKQALARASRAESVASSVTTEPLKDLLERFSIAKDVKGSRGGAEALLVLQVCAVLTHHTYSRACMVVHCCSCGSRHTGTFASVLLRL